MKVQHFLHVLLNIFLLTKIVLADSTPNDYDPKAQVCVTEACVVAANYISQNIDKSVDPCNNFYRHACGGYLSKIELKPEESSSTTFKMVHDELGKKLKSAITESNFEKLMTFKKLKDFYNMCLAEDQKTESNNEYMKILKDHGDWPVTVGASWSESTFEWNKTALQLYKEGLLNNFFINVFTQVGVKDNSKRSLMIDQGELGLDEKHLKNGWDDEIVKAYYKYMMSVAVQFKATEELAMKECREVIDFEMQLANILQSEVERTKNNANHQFMIIEQLQTQYPFMQWLDYLKGIFPSNIELDNNQPVVLLAPTYFSKLAVLAGSNKRILANYMFWRATQAIASSLGPNIRSAQSEFNKALTGSLLNPARQETCYDNLLENFPLAVGSIYVQKYVDSTTKPLIQGIFESIRQNLTSVINEVTWMKSATKEKALKKLNAMQAAISFPDELLNEQKVDEYYSSFDLVTGDYLRTVLNLKKFTNQMNLKNLRDKVERIDWTGEFGDVTRQEAYNNFQANLIIVPSGIAQDFFYNKSRPMYMNYAALGSLIGHEIMHGYDNSGRMFDDVGNVNDWWDSESASEYQTKVKCIVDQYNNHNLTETDARVDGEYTQDENIADNGGLNVTYRAYGNWLSKNNGPEPKLPGFEKYTEQQMFWLANANAGCQKIRPEQLKQMILLDKHTPFEARVNIPLSNLEDFARDFKCPQGSPMNPNNKCIIW